MVLSRRPWVRLVFAMLLLLIFGAPLPAQDGGDPGALVELYGGGTTAKVEALSYSGAAVASIPIRVPPGRAGLSPSLSLSYSSYAANGWIGVGFGLELGAVQRSSKWGLNFQGSEFSAALGGSAAELVPRPDWGGQMFGARLEAGFVKYLFKGTTAGWEAWSKDGKRFYFGTTEASRQEHPLIKERVFKWCLDRVEDPNGNFMSVEYVKERGEIYPRRISYTGNRGLAPGHAVIFHLEPRPDAGAQFNTGFEVATTRRLKSIEVRALGLLAAAYALEYTESPSTGRSLLSSVQEFGTDAAIDEGGEITAGSRRPSTLLDWQQDPPGSFSRPPAAGSLIQHFDFGGNRDQALPLDFNGDGNMDLFLCRPEWGLASVLRSNGDGSFTELYWSTNGIGGYNLKNQEDRALVLDFDGDGRSDLFFYRPDTGNVGIARSNGDGSFSPVYFSENGIGGYDFKSLRDKALAFDFNGDGRSDLLFYRPDSGKIFVLRSNGDGSFTTVLASWSGLAGFDLKGAADRVFAFDYDGDGRQDLFFYRPNGGIACVARSNGDGSFTQVYFSGGGIGGFDLRGSRDVVFPFDFNGDGKSDLFLYRPDGGIACVARSNGDGSFTAVYYSGAGIAGYDLRGVRDVVLPFDFNGDGKSDLFLYRPDGGLACVARSNGDGSFSQVYFSAGGIGGWDMRGTRDIALPMDFNGDGKADLFFYRQEGRMASVVQSGVAVPDLLTRVENPLGGLTEIAYTASSRIENHRLPFIVHPVDTITVKDGLGANPELVTRFAYQGGYYDQSEREFRGFETITQTNPEGATTRTLFHQDSLLQGKSRLTENRESAAGPLAARTELFWEAAALGGTGAHFVKLVRRQSALFNEQTVLSAEEHLYENATGNLVTTTLSGTGAEALVKRTRWESFGPWLLRPVAESLEGELTGKLRESYYAYEPGTGNLLATELWLAGGSNPRASMAYDAFGNPVAVTDALGHTTRTDYDEVSRSYPVAVERPATGGVAHVSRMQVDPRFGKPTAAIDENGNQTRFLYDPFGRLIETRAADGGLRQVEYRDSQRPAAVLTRVKESAAGGYIRGCQYVDGLGRSLQTVGFGEAGKPIVTRSFYDRMGRNHHSVGPYFAKGPEYPQPVAAESPWVKRFFDLRGRVVRIDTPAAEQGASALFAYSGLAATATDADGAAKTEKKDYLGRVVEVIEHLEGEDAVTAYAYNAAGDLLSVTNALGRAVTMAYDTLGRKTGMNDPDMGTWGYAYDAAGRLAAQTDAKGQVTRFSYDALGRVASKSYSTGDPAVGYLYDGPGVANGIGRLYEVKNANARTTYMAYDAAGRVLEISRSVYGAPKAAYTTAYRYDAAGRLLSVRYPDNYQLAYSYHPETALLRSVMGITDFTEMAAFEDYDAAGRARYLYHGNGTATTHRFDAASGRLLSSGTSDPQLAILQKRSYRYSAAGDIVGITAESPEGTATRSYRYDRLHRLLAESSLGAGESYPPAVIAPVFDERFPLHGPKIISVDGREYRLGYDENGNMVRVPDLTDPDRVRERFISYNAENMPVRIAYDGESGSGGGGGGTGSAGAGGGGGCFVNAAHARALAPAAVELFYDGEGRRAVKRVHGTRLTFYIGGHFEVAEGIETKYVFAGSMRIAAIRSGASPFYFHKDHLGSSTLVTDDENGAPVESADYLPFGVTRSRTGADIARHRYTDQEQDAETGLYNYNARLYDPALGLFITPDAIVQDPFDPQSLNRYAYARNNPLTYTDPSGHWFLVDDMILGAAMGAAIGGSYAAITGGDIKRGILTGAISGAAFGLAGGLIAEFALPIGETAVLHAMAGGMSGGINAAVTGGDVGLGIATGAVSAGAASYVGGNLPKDFVVQLLARTAMGGVTGGVTSSLYGGSFMQGFKDGATTAAYGYICNDVLHDILRGVHTAMADGSKAGAYSLRRAFHDEWIENEQLRNGTLEGFERAGKVAFVAHSFTSAKAGLIYFLAVTPGALVLSEATPIAAAVADGIAPNPPNTAKGAAINRWYRTLEKWALDPPPWK
jgi:RHS repeat-associated protein